jgi:hypothetical protein
MKKMAIQKIKREEAGKSREIELECVKRSQSIAFFLTVQVSG